MSHFIKCEINGIQEFIFNIQSKGAAKALKARSFMVDAICQLIRKIYLDAFPGAVDYFTGGGNVYLEIQEGNWSEQRFREIAYDIASKLLPYQMTASFASAEHSDLKSSFGGFIKNLNEKLNKEKLRFGIQENGIFEPVSDKLRDQKVFSNLTKEYSRSCNAEIIDVQDKTVGIVYDEFIQLSSKRFQFRTAGQRTLVPLPVRKGDIISFEELAASAKERSGTDNLGVLKMDVDNLGALFQKLSERKDNEILSDEMKKFFRGGVIELLKMKVKANNHAYTFEDNIYTVYAGGDDCFFVGAWDAVIEFAINLQKKFARFEAEVLRTKLPLFKDPITVSASIIIIDSHFPVVRFAEIVEQNLKEAKARKQDKTDASGKPMKNNISFMGHVFSWSEFYEMEAVKNTLDQMIRGQEERESKALLHRIINSFENNDTAYWHNCKPEKPFNPAILWRFLYSFRDVKDKSYFTKKGYYDLFFSRAEGYYRKYVWQQFNPGKKMSQVMPVAARWAELLNRL